MNKDVKYFDYPASYLCVNYGGYMQNDEYSMRNIQNFVGRRHYTSNYSSSTSPSSLSFPHHPPHPH